MKIITNLKRHQEKRLVPTNWRTATNPPTNIENNLEASLDFQYNNNIYSQNAAREYTFPWSDGLNVLLYSRH